MCSGSNTDRSYRDIKEHGDIAIRPVIRYCTTHTLGKYGFTYDDTENLFRTLLIKVFLKAVLARIRFYPIFIAFFLFYMGTLSNLMKL